MEKKQLKRIGEQAIRDVVDYIEKQDSEIEIEEWEDSVEINPSGSNCVLNYHNVLSQIWFASSEKGAYHFSYNENTSEWISTCLLYTSDAADE